jgi:hypothetical protein
LLRRLPKQQSGGAADPASENPAKPPITTASTKVLLTAVCNLPGKKELFRQF